MGLVQARRGHHGAMVEAVLASVRCGHRRCHGRADRRSSGAGVDALRQPGVLAGGQCGRTDSGCGRLPLQAAVPGSCGSAHRTPHAARIRIRL